MPRTKYLLEYAFLRLVSGLLRLLPYEAALAAAWCLAAVAFHLLRFRRRETLRRIRAVFDNAVAPHQARRIAWLSLRNTCFNAVELMRTDRFTSDWMRRHVQGHTEVIGAIKELLAEHRGLVIATPHMGNWDLAGIAAHLEGVVLFTVAANQRNPLVNAWLNRQRGHGIEVMPRGAAVLRHTVKRLRQGEAFAILPDVRTRRPDLTVPFLGGTANLGRGMAQFARVAGVPILPVIVRRQGWRRHVFAVLPPVFPDKHLDKDVDLPRMTVQVMAGIDAAIRADPGQWFWYNKRWVLEPLDAAVAPPTTPPEGGDER